MKIDEFEKFNGQCGLAKVCDIENQEWFVVYADTFEEKSLEDHHLGTVVGKGKTKKDAMKHAITVLLNKIIKTEKKMTEIEENIQKIFANGILEEEEIILPVEGWDSVYDQESGNYNCIDNGIFHNADVLLIKGKAILGTL